MSSIPAATPHTPAPAALPAAGPADARFGPTHQLILLLAFLGLGAGLFTTGTPMNSVFTLLGGCGAIGAATITTAGGGRRLARALAEAALRAAVGQ
ncbi:hypothetical protein POF50_008475 [Streptomyces sp. SL13]|uniref:Uncharacterized protein n=1 Tax=Streptantibioticus silvisoli TaxID=2705255 RepID=A0AA90GZI9_9ACTN|nr:hypothetical protein [Streptantibioticus silvisoli]MDI5969381.1 hypothetical protein [Streptantibioticus silvisoli]